MAVDPEWLRRLQEQALMGAQQSPTNFNPEMMAANAPMPNPQFEGAGLGGMLRRGAIGFQNGLGRVQQAMFPIDSTQAAGMSAEDIKTARNQAMMKMGLGMMGAAGQGAGGGEALAHGYGLAQGGMNDQLQQRMQNARVQQQDQRQLERDQIGDERYTQEFAYQQEQDRARMEMEKQAQAAAQERFNANLVLDKRGLGLREREINLQGMPSLGKPPAGYEWKPDGSGLRAIPGGPADPSAEKTKVTDTQRQTAAYAERMRSATETLDKLEYQPTAMDLSLFKTMVGEPGFKQSMANSAMSGEAQQYFQALQDFSRAKLRKESGAVITAEEIFGDLATFFPLPGDDDKTIEQKRAARGTVLSGMEASAGAALQPRKPAEVTKTVNGKRYVQIDGQWYEEE